MEFFIWIFFWLIIWVSFNVYFKWIIYKTGKKRYFLSTLFFLLNTFIFFLFFQKFLDNIYSLLILAWITTTLMGFFLSDYFPFYKRIKNGKYYLAALPANILLQQSMNFVMITLLIQNYSNGYIDVYFGILFFAFHLPILFCRWAKLRYLYLILTFFAGTAFSYLTRIYGTTGVFLSFLIHYLAYVPIFYKLRDERKM